MKQLELPQELVKIGQWCDGLILMGNIGIFI